MMSSLSWMLAGVVEQRFVNMQQPPRRANEQSLLGAPASWPQAASVL